jgi:SAM-dependent methyltransferase
MGSRAAKATLFVADIVDLSALPAAAFSLVLAMGDPLSICSDAQKAAEQFRRITAPGGVVIATADNKLAALDHYVERGNLDALEQFVRTGATRWLTADERERFELTTFTPASLRKLFERAGFEVVDLIGKTIIPVRRNKHLLTHPDAERRLIELETLLSKDPAAAATAGHLQVVARRPRE